MKVVIGGGHFKTLNLGSKKHKKGYQKQYMQKADSFQ